MTNFEKLCEAAGVKYEFRDYRTKNGKTYPAKNTKNRNIRPCLPRFTAEKQLELENLIISKIGCLRIEFFPKLKELSEHWQYNVFGGSFEINSKNYTGETRAETVTKLALQLIETGELEKEYVRRILE